ncbi:MAG: CCA tRNA nucleotidyltransferase [Armatimonadota bacterium]
MRLQVYGRIGQSRCNWLRSLGRLGAQMETPVYLVGGPVRDLILCRPTLDTDIAVEGDAHAYARALAEHEDAHLTFHKTFGTGVLRYPNGRHLDIAGTRSEEYPRPGALPRVSPADLRTDLGRRDFTINALAMDLRPDSFGTLIDPLGGFEDLRAGRLAALHHDSFRDDPTRVLRAARFRSRFSLKLVPETRSWLALAVDNGCMSTVSPQRLLTELWYLLADPYPRGALELLECWDAHSYLDLPAGLAERIGPVDALPVARRKLGNMPGVEAIARAALALCFDTPQRAAAWTRMWPVRADRAAAVREACSAVHNPPGIIFSKHVQNIKLHMALDGLCRAAQFALWVTGGDRARATLEHFAHHLQGTRADVTGEDLIALGYTPGPQFRKALQEALEVKLDCDAGRDEQLAAARRVLETYT